MAARNPTPARANPARNPDTTEPPTIAINTRSRKLTRSSELVSGQFPIGIFVFSAGLLGDILWQRGCRRLLVPLDGFQVIADELLVIRRLSLSRSILSRWPEARRIRRQDLICKYDLAADDSKLEFRIGDDDPARAGVVGRFLVDAERQVA